MSQHGSRLAGAPLRFTFVSCAVEGTTRLNSAGREYLLLAMRVLVISGRYVSGNTHKAPEYP